MDVSIPGRRVRGSKQNGSGGHQVVLVQNAGGRCAGAREAGAGCYSRFLEDGDRVAGQTSSAFGLREMAFRGSIHSQAPAQALDSLKQAFAAPAVPLAFNHPEYRLFDSDKTSSARTVAEYSDEQLCTFSRLRGFRVLAAQGLTVKRSHLSEVIAALLGYRTHAALSVEEADPKLDYHLEDAEILVLNLPMGERRAAELGLAAAGAAPSAVTTACVEALKASAGSTDVYVSVADFYDLHARQALAETIYNADDVAGAMAESNASFPDEPDMDIECPRQRTCGRRSTNGRSRPTAP